MFRSRWSHGLFARVGTGQFEHVITVPLVMEYEEVLHRQGMVPLPTAAVDDVLDDVCASGLRQQVHFLWRPKLADVRDDRVLEGAFNGNCDAIVTWNVRDFAAASDMSIKILQPDQFVKRLKESKP